MVLQQLAPEAILSVQLLIPQLYNYRIIVQSSEVTLIDFCIAPIIAVRLAHIRPVVVSVHQWDPGSILWRAFFFFSFFFSSSFFFLPLSPQLAFLFFPSFFCPPLIFSSPFPLLFFLFYFYYSFSIRFLSFLLLVSPFLLLFFLYFLPLFYFPDIFLLFLSSLFLILFFFFAHTK